MSMRLLHLVVIGMLMFAAAYVYRIKMESTLRTERVMQLRADIRGQRDAIAALRAEWSQLDNPARLQDLVQRHLALRKLDATQFDTLAGLPDKPPSFAAPGVADPIGAIIEIQETELGSGSGTDVAEDQNAVFATGSIEPEPERDRP